MGHSVAVPDSTTELRRAALDVFLRKPTTDRRASRDLLKGGLPTLTDDEADSLSEWCIQAWNLALGRADAHREQPNAEQDRWQDESLHLLTAEFPEISAEQAWKLYAHGLFVTR